jgi:hypothetical protein
VNDHPGIWRVGLAFFVAVRVAVPLAALAASGQALPGLPRYDYDGFTGDATGYYAASREFIASGPRLGTAGLALLVLGLVAVFVLLRRGSSGGRLPAHWALVIGALAVGTAIAVVITKMSPPGAAVVGWPLVWSIPLFPLRAAGLLHTNAAFAAGLALSLIANSVTTIATAALGVRATGSRAVGLAAAGLWAFWPLLVGGVAGERAWGNGSWTTDVGLSMYTEPVSTALVTSALALVLAPRLTPLRLSAVGIALSLATIVKSSDGILAAAIALICLAQVGRTRILPLIAGGLTLAPAVIAYWPRGYPKITGPTAERPVLASSLDAAARNWLDSLVFSPRTLLALVPVAALGVAGVRSGFARWLLVLPVVVNAAFYTGYAYTADHPRFLYVSLPAVFVLWAAGAKELLSFLRGISIRSARPGRSSRPDGKVSLRPARADSAER